MNKLYEMAMESVLVRGVIALMFASTVCFMYASGREVPDSLVGMLGIILGSFFQAAATRRAETERLRIQEEVQSE